MTNEMLMEDWLRGCVHHDGKNGYVTLPCDEVMKIADYIESTRGKVEVVRCKDCKWADWYTTADGHIYCCCMETGNGGRTENDYCSYGESDDADDE